MGVRGVSFYGMQYSGRVMYVIGLRVPLQGFA